MNQRAPENVVLISDLTGHDVARFVIPRNADAIGWDRESGQLVAVLRQARTAVHLVDLNGTITKLIAPTLAAVALGRTEQEKLVVTLSSATDTSGSVIDLLTRSPVSEVAPPPRPRVPPPTRACGVLVDLVRQREVQDVFVCDEGGQKVFRGRSAPRLPASALVDITSVARLDDSTLVGTTPLSVVALSVPSGARRALLSLETGRMMTRGLSASGDGRWLAATSTHEDSLTERLHLIPLHQDARRDIARVGIGGGAPIWDPQRRFVLYVAEIDGRADLWLEPLSGDPARRLTTAERNGVGVCCVMAPDGSGAAYTVNAGSHVSLWRVTIPPLPARGGVPPQ